ncbi:rap1 GTPase-GDP dissociation stimulator 1-B isoform X3 [Poecilia formosa]|uniref:rap1 GTPase-GDP dissociation stimulator 1-B isoform X3 n=1 Tax=Poecilia formosa TaxID=48698 RepID=UPI0007B8DFE2|nr:PREDICTED: rap1 GTPase-GDP dissociation stimulator 1 isoform X3 [Poecilia formosa]
MLNLICASLIQAHLFPSFCHILLLFHHLHRDTLQAQLINLGVIPTLVKLLGIHSHNTALTEMCLIAFGNLAELESSKEQFASTNIADELVHLFQKQTEHEKKEMIFEVLAPLAENDVIKLQLVEAGLVECLLEVVAQTVDGEREEDIAQLKTASDLMVLLLLGDESMQKLFEGGKGSVFQRVLSWIPSHNHQLQLAGALAIANFARNAEAAEQLGTNGKLVERLVEWCEAKDHAGVMGESNRLLSALIRHSKSKEVVRTVIQKGGVKHLVTMATSEHMIMQNEALVALGLIAALDLVAAEKDFVGANLVSVLHKLLSDERSAPEIKYNSMILICAVMGSEPLHKEVQSLAFIDVVSKLRSHENKTVSHQASLTEQRLTAQS